MINQKMIFAIVVGFVVMFGLAGLFHLVIMKDFFEARVGVASSMMYPMLSYVIVAILMSYMYPMMNKGASVIKDGLCFGIFVGLLIRVPSIVLHLGYGTGDLNFLLVDGVWHCIEEGIGGIAIAMIYARGTNG